MPASWQIPLIGAGVFAALCAIGVYLWLPAYRDATARVHMGSSVATGALVALAVFIVGSVNACSAASAEHRRQIAFLINQKGKNLIGVDLSGEDLGSAYLRARNLTSAQLHASRLGRANLAGAILDDADLSRARLRSSQLQHAQLIRATLDAADLQDADLDSANLHFAGLSKADLRGATLAGANLVNADLGGANLENADLTAAHLEDASLVGAHLNNAVLQFAHLNGADLSGAHLDGANMDGVDIAGVSYNRQTSWPRDPHFACTRTGSCTIAEKHSPRQKAFTALHVPEPLVHGRMHGLKLLLFSRKNSPDGWTLRFWDSLGMEVDSVGTVAGDPDKRVPLATFTAEPFLAWAPASSKKGREQEAYALYKNQAPDVSDPNYDWTAGGTGPVALCGWGRTGAAYATRYRYSGSDGREVMAFELYYVGRKLLFVFHADVEADKYLRYQGDLVRFFTADLGAPPSFPLNRQIGHDTESCTKRGHRPGKDLR